MRLLENYEAGYVMLVRSYNNTASMKKLLIRDRPSREQSVQERETETETGRGGEIETKLQSCWRIEISGNTISVLIFKLLQLQVSLGFLYSH